MKPTALIIAGPGTNRDRDLAWALGRAGAEPTIRLVSELAGDRRSIARADLIAVAGGFSYGDALGAGRLLALDLVHGLGSALGDFVASGRPLIGICNGFQVLTRAGVLPGALGHNADGRFDCRWVELAPEPASRCVWTIDLPGPIECPIAHGEGRYVHPDPDGLAAAGQVALRYAGSNPNGSVGAIAAVCNPAGNVLGLMPHPENHIVARQHPHRAAGGAGNARHDASLGLHLFRNGVDAARHARVA